MYYESLRAQMRYENDGNGSRETRGRIRVQNDAGLALAGQLVFNYNAENETVEIRSVRVLKSDGTVVTTGLDNVQDLSAPVARVAPVYSDAREKHVTVAGLSVGDTVEYDVVINSKPLDPGQFWQTYSFAKDAVTLDEELELNVPKDRALKLHSPDGVTPEVREDGDRRIYTWKSHNCTTASPLPNPQDVKVDVQSMLEGYHPPPPPQVVFSTFQSWSDVGEWYAGLEKDRREPSASIRAQADQIVQGKTTEEQKAEALYDWVGRNIRYVSLSFGVGRYQPHSAADVLANRYGDCKDKATLLESLMAAEGIHANTALMNATREVNLDVPTPLAFDHAINYATIDGTPEWLDSTVGIGAFGYLLPQLRGKYALVTGAADSSSIQKTPSALPFTPSYRLSVNGKADKQSFDIIMRIELRGDAEALARLAFTRVSPAQFSTIMQQYAAKGNNGTASGASIQFSDFAASDPLDTSQPFHAQIRMTGQMSPEQAEAQEGKSGDQHDALAEFTSNMFAQSDILRYLLPAAPESDDQKAASPLWLGGPKDCALELNMTLAPEIAGKPAHPGSSNLHTDFAEFASNVTWDGKTAHALWDLKVIAKEVSPANLKAYSDFREKVLEALGASTASKPVVAGSPSSSVPALVPADAHGLYLQGESDLRQQNFANAIEHFQSALKIDPNYKEAWRGLGQAQMFLGKHSDAEATFRKYLGLAPDDRFAYTSLAWALGVEKKYDEEIDLLKKRVEAMPNDAQTHALLGAAYLSNHQPDKAVPELERAVEIAPKYPYALGVLASAYLESHQNDKAVDAFQRSLDANPSDVAFNNAAYELSEKKAALGTAEKWSARSIGEVETELNQGSLDANTWHLAALDTRLSTYWDTMGWIQFQKADYASAEKYLTAAWQLADDSVMAIHLGHIYQAQGKNYDALAAYSAALDQKSPGRELTDDEKDAASQVAVLSAETAASPAATSAAAKERFRSLRSVSVPNATHLQGIGQYSLLISADSKIADIRPLGADSGLAEVAEAARSVAMPQVFPDKEAQKVFRLATLACSSPDQACTLALLPAGSAIRLLPQPQSPSSNPE